MSIVVKHGIDPSAYANIMYNYGKFKTKEDRRKEETAMEHDIRKLMQSGAIQAWLAQFKENLANNFYGSGNNFNVQYATQAGQPLRGPSNVPIIDPTYGPGSIYGQGVGFKPMTQMMQAGARKLARMGLKGV